MDTSEPTSAGRTGERDTITDRLPENRDEKTGCRQGAPEGYIDFLLSRRRRYVVAHMSECADVEETGD